MLPSLLLLVSSLLCATAAPTVFLMGGASIPLSVWQEFVYACGGRGQARIGLITAANLNPPTSATFYSDLLLHQLGAASVLWIPAHIGNLSVAEDPAMASAVDQLDGLFFGGGDQQRIVQTLVRVTNSGDQPTPVLAAIQRRFRAGQLVVGGTSAGAMALTTEPMILDGSSLEALVHGVRWARSDKEPDHLVCRQNGGIKLLDNLMIDTHFSERGREGRLTAALAHNMFWRYGTRDGRGLTAVGLDEATALVIQDPNSARASARVIGTGGVFIVYMRERVPIQTGSGNAQSVRGASISYLTYGDVIQLSSRQVTFAPWKINLEGNEYYQNSRNTQKAFVGKVESNKIAEFVAIATRLVDSKSRRTIGVAKDNSNRVTLQLNKVAETRGYGGRVPLDSEWHVSYSNIHMDVFINQDPNRK